MTINNRNTDKRNFWNNKEPAQVPAQDIRSRSSLDPVAFDNLIKSHGVRVKVYRTMYCPNVKSVDGGEHEINCEQCNGSGFIDVHPIQTVAYIQNQGYESNFNAEGHSDGNTVSSTFLGGIELQYFTRIDLLDFTEPFFERLLRNDTNIDFLKYSAARVNVVIDSSNNEYYQGVDFKLDVNGNIQWNTGSGPAENVIYSVHYESIIQYRAIRAVHVSRFAQVPDKQTGGVAQVKLPEQWTLQKEFLVLRRNNEGTVIGPQPLS